MTVLLALDTSTDTMALALSSPAGVSLHEGESGAKSSAHMVPELMALLARAGLSLSGVDAIAFGRGPGAFTGLRTACAVAQGLAFGAAKPVLPIDSLMIVAEDAAAANEAARTGLCWVAMDARMGEIYAACYRWARDQWLVHLPPALYTREGFEQQLRHPAPPDAPQTVTGSALSAFGTGLDTGRIQRLPDGPSRAAALARVAQQQWALGLTVEAEQALPLYLRDKVAQTTAERQALARSAA